MQPPFEYDGHALAALRSSLSAERLQRYESIAAGDASQALRLYVWNTALSESFYGPIQGLEVTLRNKIHERLAHPFGPCWYEDARVALQYVQRDQILRASNGTWLALHRYDFLGHSSQSFRYGLFRASVTMQALRPHVSNRLNNST